MEKVVEKVEQVVGYRATDGTFFKQEAACKEYEQSALVAAADAAKALETARREADSLSSMLCMSCEDDIAVYRIKNAEDLQVVNTYLKLLCPDNQIVEPEGIAEKVAIQHYCYDNYTCVLGTRSNMEYKFKAILDKLFGPEDGTNAE